MTKGQEYPFQKNDANDKFHLGVSTLELDKLFGMVGVQSLKNGR